MSLQGYWNDRYKSGGDSGAGSRGLLRLWKWHKLVKYLQVERFTAVKASVIDVGCGDLAFWKNFTCKNYTGIDFSETRCQENSVERPNWKFICSGAEVPQQLEKAEAVLCFDMLFHVVNETTFLMVLKNLTDYSSKYIFVYTWFINPLESATDAATAYQKFRDFTEYRFMFERKGFRIVGFHKCPDFIDKYGAMWVFEKEPTTKV